MNIFLIGYRGTGKSTIGRLLAARTGRTFVDADVFLETRAGRSIQAIFALDGEPTFRQLECEVVAQLSQGDRQVLALGGGAVMREENRAAMRGRGPAVWLQANVETIAERLAADPTTGQRRPNLTASGGYAEIKEMLERRQEVYRQCATITVDTEGKNPERIVDEILALLERSPSPDSSG